MLIAGPTGDHCERATIFAQPWYELALLHSSGGMK
jgi:hypothetical protein